MNEAAYMVFIGVFLVLPPALLVTRLFDKARMPWLLLVALSVVVGWLLVNLACMFYVNHLLLQMSATGDVMLGNSNTFGSNEFLFDFGWSFGPAYLMPWLILYGVFVFGRRRLASHGT